MSTTIKFDFSQTKIGNFKQAKEAIISAKKGDISGNNLLYAIDAAATNPEFLEKFQKGFSKVWGHEVKFRSLTDDEMKLQDEVQKNYDITQTSIATTIGTNIIPTMEHLIRSTALLSKISIERINSNEFYQMFDFDSEQLGVTLTEVAPGSDVDEVLRSGDKLIPNNKAQASFKLSEFAINTMSGYLLGKYLARLANRVKSVIINSVLYSGSVAANGTAKNNVRGIKNNFGVSATGDATGTIGAIVYASKATADAAIVAAGGIASTDRYDLAVKAKEMLLPPNLIDVEEDDYVYIMNRASWGSMSTIQDANGRYKAQSAMDPVTGKAIKTLDGAEVIVDPRVAINEVFIVPLKWYTLIMNGDILNLNDGGVVQLREGLTVFVSRAWIDGSLEYGQKFRPTTPVVIGTTVPDNQAQNAWLVITLA